MPALRRPRLPRLPRAPDGRIDPIFWLLFGQLVMFTGIAAIFPVLPLYVAHRGGNSLTIALFIASPMVANMLVQVPAGHLTDRIGRKPILIGARLAYAVFALGLFADVGPLWFLAVLRTLQGASGGAYIPALRAAIADVTAPERRGERFSQLQAAEMVGLLVGPLLGGAAALWRDNACFLVSGVAVLFGTTALTRLTETRGAQADEPEEIFVAGARWWRRRGILVPCLGLFTVGAVFSMYDVVWPQYLGARGFDPFIIGVSISIYAVPILVLARAGGRLSDRTDRRRLLAAAMTVAAASACVYPGLRFLAPILLVGTVEATAMTVIEPTLFAVMSDASAPQWRGRAMGFGGMFEFGGSGIGAALLGALYGVDERIPFYAAAAGLLVAAALCALLIPARARGSADALPVRADLELYT